MAGTEDHLTTVNGKAMQVPSLAKPKLEPQFLSTLPSLIKTSYDSRYLPTVNKALNEIRTISPAIKCQLAKDYAVEEDEIRLEVREKLERLSEGLRMLDGDEESDDDGSAGVHNESDY